MISYILAIIDIIKNFLSCMNVEKHTHHHSKYDPKTGKKIESDDYIDEITSLEKNKKLKKSFCEED